MKIAKVINIYKLDYLFMQTDYKMPTIQHNVNGEPKGAVVVYKYDALLYDGKINEGYAHTTTRVKAAEQTIL